MTESAGSANARELKPAAPGMTARKRRIGMGVIRIENTSITNLGTDAIVNAANTGLWAGTGVCGAVFAAAGYPALQAACKAIGHCDVGSAVITPGFNLPAKYIIHAVGPQWSGGENGEPQLLYSAYRSALNLALANSCHSVGFPLISAGVFGYPLEAAWQVAIKACQEFLQIHPATDMEIVFAVIDTRIQQTGQMILRRTNIRMDKVDSLSVGEKMVDAVCFDRPDEANGYLSSEYAGDSFTVDGIRFSSAGQYIVYRKCMLFDDTERAEMALDADDPVRQQRIGRSIAGFNAVMWDGRKQMIVYQAHLARFSQNEALRLLLLNTGSACLVKCGPNDLLWGCGFGTERPERLDMRLWRGRNLLGFTLMEVRETLAGGIK